MAKKKAKATKKRATKAPKKKRPLVPRVTPAPKPTEVEKRAEKLRHPSKFRSLAAWMAAMERAYGRHHVDWPAWGVRLMQAHVTSDVRRA